MEIKEVSTDSLIEYAFNNRIHSDSQVDKIANSIREYGFNQAIVVDEDNVILVGHGRLAAARKLGLATVPVLKREGLNDAQKRAYRILDNKLQNDSEWNFENLKLEMDLLEAANYPIEEWGLDSLADLMPEPEPEVKEDDFDTEPTSDNETFIKRGDLIELGEHRVLCGDCTEINDVLKLVQEKSVDLVMTDPPYNLAEETELFGQATSKALSDLSDADWDKGFDPDKFLSVVVRLIKKDAWVAVFTSLYLFGQIADFLKGNLGFTHFFCWCKPNPMPSLRKKCFTSAVELCVLGKSGSPYFGYPDGTHALNYLEQTKKGYKGHPTAKTVEVIGELVTRLSDKGSVVFDPFLGSGTTLIAAEQLGRRCYGMELAPKYCDLILRRYAKHVSDQGKKPDIRVNGEAIDLAILEEVA